MTPNISDEADDVHSAEVNLDEDGHLLALGAKCRGLRNERSLTLKTVAERTGMSSSMISMVERGRTSPSVGTLVALSSALGVRVSDLFDFHDAASVDPVTRRVDQASISTAGGVTHRSVVPAGESGIEMNMNSYEVGGESASVQLHHAGHELGVVLEGTLMVELGDESFTLQAGDSIRYDSSRPHRISNVSDARTRTVWVNVSH